MADAPTNCQFKYKMKIKSTILEFDISMLLEFCSLDYYSENSKLMAHTPTN